MSVDLMIKLLDYHLTVRLSEFERMLDNQMLDLKYGKGYRDRMLDEIIKELEGPGAIGTPEKRNQYEDNLRLERELLCI